MNRFDENKNNVMEPAEGAKMARALGYNEIIPTTSVIYEIQDYSPDIDACNLHICNTGIYIGSIGSPVWEKWHKVYTERLEEIVKGK